MTKKELVKVVAKASGLTQEQSSLAIDALREVMLKELLTDGKFIIHGIGKLSVSSVAARIGFNVREGRDVPMAESKRICFKSFRSFKSVMNGESGDAES